MQQRPDATPPRPLSAAPLRSAPMLATLLLAGLPFPALAQDRPVQQMANDTVIATTSLSAPQNDRPVTGDAATSAAAPPAPPAAKKMKPDLLVVPIPMSNPTVGAGLTVAGVLFYNPNGSSQPWVTGGGAFYTTNKSWGAGAVHSMSLDDDRFKVLLFGGYADINMQFYGIGANAGDRDISVDLEDRGTMILSQGQYEIAEHFYVGARYRFLKVNSRIKRENPLFPDLNLPGNLLDSQTSGIGPAVTYDSRDNQFAPRKGANVTLVGVFNMDALGSDFSYNTWQFAASGYFPATSTGTLAIHGSLCAVSKGAPFYDLCMYGQNGDLRGYEMGRYRDRAMWTAQVEWRQQMSDRFGGVLFGGIGGIGDSLGDLDHGKFLPAVGMGLRYKASPETGTNLRLDIAMGRDSQAIYFGIGEAF